MDEDKKFVDESWKESAEQEKEVLVGQSGENNEKSSSDTIQNDTISDNAEEPVKTEAGTESPEKLSDIEINFLNYITSLGYQAMIFLGEIPNPVTNENEQNLDQAKFLIDTLVMLSDKTKGNLNSQEENLLKASVYELQMKFVELKKKGQENA